MSDALRKAVLELLRVVVLAIIPVLITSLQEWVIDWQMVAVVAGIAALRFVDKYLHELGKKHDNPRLIKGVTRF